MVKYALGLDPTVNCAGKLPASTVVGSNLVLSFTQPSPVSGITYGAQFSTSLSSTDWHAVVDTGVFPQHVFSVPIAGNSQMFMRLQITGP